MPGPGPHMIYALGSGLGLMVASNGRFSPHHCVCYALNAFFGPDIGSFTEWLTSTIGFGDSVGSAVADVVHHPLYYVVLLSIPLSLLYSWASRVALQKGLLDSVSGVPLIRSQCFLLISAGSLSHFFLDHLFEENGKTSEYTWILSTGWWTSRAPINPDAVIVVSLLCTGLIVGFIYIHRIYLVQPRRPAVGEEADLGVLVFLFVYFFLPHSLCITSMNPKDYHEAAEQLAV